MVLWPQKTFPFHDRFFKDSPCLPDRNRRKTREGSKFGLHNFEWHDKLAWFIQSITPPLLSWKKTIHFSLQHFFTNVIYVEVWEVYYSAVCVFCFIYAWNRFKNLWEKPSYTYQASSARVQVLQQCRSVRLNNNNQIWPWKTESTVWRACWMTDEI